MSNRQAITIFVFGIGFLLAAFWAGMTVARNGVSSASSASSTTPAKTAATRRPAATPASAAPAAPADQASAAGTRYIVRVAAFGTQNDADKFAMELRRKYLSAHTQEPSGDDDSLYRVDIGPYEQREEAEAVAHELGVEGHKGVIILPVEKR